MVTSWRGCACLALRRCSAILRSSQSSIFDLFGLVLPAPILCHLRDRIGRKLAQSLVMGSRLVEVVGSNDTPKCIPKPASLACPRHGLASVVAVWCSARRSRILSAATLTDITLNRIIITQTLVKYCAADDPSRQNETDTTINAIHPKLIMTKCPKSSNITRPPFPQGCDGPRQAQRDGYTTTYFRRSISRLV